MPIVEAGRVVAGRYRIQEQLGEGGMGSVWRAEHVALKSPVAVKFLNAAIADHPEMLERFMREAQSAAALRGSYVVQIFDYGVEEGMPYIAMELLQGESLADRLDRQKVLTVQELQRFFPQVARAVSKAHEAGIVHRDLKPDNIFIVREGDEEIAKVLDFGIAKISEAGLSVSSGSGTRTGAMLGTPYYMSPEQARGKKAVDHRTDLWALAIIGYECLVGRRPFDSDALGDLVLQICTTVAPVPSEHAAVPKGFDAWFLRGSNKDPEQRFQSARQMAEALEQALTGTLSASVSGVGATVYSSTGGNPRLKLSTHGGAVVSAAPRSAAGSPLLWAAGAALLLIGGIATFVFRSGAPEQAVSEPTAGAAGATAPPPVPAMDPAKPALHPIAVQPSAPPAASGSNDEATPVAPAAARPEAPKTPVLRKPIKSTPTQPAPAPAQLKPAQPEPAAASTPSGADLFSDRQ